MTRYLLPCPCSRRIPVTPGQAGGSVSCPECGVELAVPRLGELGRLDREAPAARPRSAGRGWNAALACSLGGVFVSIGALIGASWLHGWRSGVAPLDDAAINANVAAAPVEHVYESWLEFERRGIIRPSIPEEARRQRQAQALQGLETIAWVTAAAGAAAALASGAIAGWRRRTTDRIPS